MDERTPVRRVTDSRNQLIDVQMRELSERINRVSNLVLWGVATGDDQVAEVERYLAKIEAGLADLVQVRLKGN